MCEVMIPSPLYYTKLITGYKTIKKIMYLIEFTYILEAIYLAPQDAQQSSVP
jgi:hypothetical protein